MTADAGVSALKELITSSAEINEFSADHVAQLLEFASEYSLPSAKIASKQVIAAKLQGLSVLLFSICWVKLFSIGLLLVRF
jgi:hypothetical protein